MTHEEMRERVAALKHDLGKYVAWTSANLEDSAWSDPPGPELMDALRRDVLSTRTRAGESESAWQVWERLSEGLDAPLAHELQEVARAVDTLRAIGPALESGDTQALAGRVEDVRRAQTEIRVQLRDLHRRLAREAD